MKKLKVAWWFPASPKQILLFGLAMMIVSGSFFNAVVLLTLGKDVQIENMFYSILMVYIVTLATGLIVGIAGRVLLFLAELCLTFQEWLEKQQKAH